MMNKLAIINSFEIIIDKVTDSVKTLAFYTTVLFTTVKSFAVQTHGAVFTTILSLLLMNGPNKLDCFSLARLSTNVCS